MPILQYVPQDPTDTVLQGEQVRAQGADARPSDAGSVLFGPIMGLDISGLDRLVQDEDQFLPMNSFVETSRLGVARGKEDGPVIRNNAGVMSTVGAWIPVMRNECGPMAQRPGAWAVFSLTGVSRDNTGSALGGCTVKVFRTADDTKAPFDTVSDASGNWSVNVGAERGPFWLREEKDGSPYRAGTSINTLVPTES